MISDKMKKIVVFAVLGIAIIIGLLMLGTMQSRMITSIDTMTIDINLEEKTLNKAISRACRSAFNENVAKDNCKKILLDQVQNKNTLPSTKHYRTFDQLPLHIVETKQ